MEKILHILIVEDLESDAEIAKRILTQDGIKFVDRIVDTKEDYIDALSTFSPDLILSDYSLPQFDGMKALLLRQELAPHIPFVLVTGSMNEEVAVECMKSGADDYVIKQNIIRLIPAIKGAMLKQETMRLRREAESALRESEKKFRNLYTHMDEGVGLHKLVFDADGRPVNYRIVDVNRQYEKILNIKAKDVLGKLATEIYGNTVPPYFDEYLKVVNQEKSFTFETFYAPLNKHFMISISPWDKDGFATIFTDITDRIQATEEIKKERKMLRTFIDNIPDTVYVKDAECRKIISNPADLKIIGRATEADIIGTTDLEIFPGETGRRGYADDLSVLQTGQPVINREEDFVDGDGNHRWLLTSKIPLFDDAGKVTGLVGIGHDITVRKRVEEEIRQKVEELAISNEELSRFNRLAIGREMRMLEIKKYCNLLASQLGVQQPYPLAFLKANQRMSAGEAVSTLDNNIEKKGETPIETQR